MNFITAETFGKNGIYTTKQVKMVTNQFFG